MFASRLSQAVLSSVALSRGAALHVADQWPGEGLKPKPDLTPLRTDNICTLRHGFEV